MYLNQATIIGNLTRDPELKSLPSGINVASFSMATNRVYKDKDQKKQESVEYHNVVAFGKTAELIGQYLKKGSQALIIGRLQTRSWDKDGVKMYRTEIVADTVQFGSKPKSDVNTTTPDAIRTPEEQREIDGMDGVPTDDEINPDDIPF